VAAMLPIPNGDSAERRPRVTVVIPTLNEERNLPYVAARMPADIDEVVVVDGHSLGRHRRGRQATVA
jgi:hypothetical protein